MPNRPAEPNYTVKRNPVRDSRGRPSKVGVTPTRFVTMHDYASGPTIPGQSVDPDPVVIRPRGRQ
jgi:hypothetical protein